MMDNKLVILSFHFMQVRRLEHEKSHLESLIASMKQKHQEEVNAIDTNNRSRIAMVEESYQRRELRSVAIWQS